MKRKELDAHLMSIASGAAGVEALKLVGETLDELRDNVIGQALKQLDTASLSPNAALLFWGQIYGIENLRKRLLKVVRTGAAAGDRVADKMEIKDG